ncbi:uncharacterized protein LOC130960723 isoform X2 [Arachis stenosperma]|uniref:uncharacterized protein LOC130960723 isoform X2 n=1 Tax=Arachis stenosperma TaxID=217475 RepID=UPI0025AC6953|nr:uncharacterized protein LOC130960723 isoform X2 [Arachis stenosperma]
MAAEASTVVAVASSSSSSGETRHRAHPLSPFVAFSLSLYADGNGNTQPAGVIPTSSSLFFSFFFLSPPLFSVSFSSLFVSFPSVWREREGFVRVWIGFREGRKISWTLPCKLELLDQDSHEPCPRTLGNNNSWIKDLQHNLPSFQIAKFQVKHRSLKQHYLCSHQLLTLGTLLSLDSLSL